MGHPISATMLYLGLVAEQRNWADKIWGSGDKAENTELNVSEGWKRKLKAYKAPGGQSLGAFTCHIIPKSVVWLVGSS